jgi:hypothetical protein
MSDWSTLGNKQRGLAVEGKRDKDAVEAFLTAGDGPHWDNWRAQIEVKPAGDAKAVWKELDREDPRIWGLIDPDWRTPAELEMLRQKYPRLLILPRVMIENYFIDPAEVQQWLPEVQRHRLTGMQAIVDSVLHDWVANGALWQTLHLRGAHDFCRGHEDGYPMAILQRPLSDEGIERQFQQWVARLDSQAVYQDYDQQRQAFQAAPDQHFTHHLHGKNFFNQVIVSAVLNPLLGQRAEDDWVKDLLIGVEKATVPADLAAALQRDFVP